MGNRIRTFLIRVAGKLITGADHVKNFRPFDVYKALGKLGGGWIRLIPKSLFINSSKFLVTIMWRGVYSLETRNKAVLPSFQMQ